MFDFVKSSKVLVGIILGLLAIPFAFFGIDFYFRGGDSVNRVADVGGMPITAREFTQALQQQQDRLRQAAGGKADAAMLDSPELREAVLSQLVDERVAYRAALKSGITVTNAELQATIASIPAFRENGGSGPFSRKLYEAALRTQGMDEPMFEGLLRRDLVLGRARGTLSGTAFVPSAVVDRLYRLGQQEREVSQAVFSPEQFAAGAKVEPSEAQAYYEANKAQFVLPEKIKIEYVILSLEGIQKHAEVSPEEIKQYYEERRAQFEVPEERRARHILISIPPNATAEQKAKAKARAEALLAEARKAPKSFPDLAKKSSEDPGSAAQGGDLGFFAHGRMVKPFDEAVFGMSAGDIAGPVETQYGYHVLKLEEVKGASGPSFDAVKAQVEAELKKAQAGKRFAESAESFSNLVYEQPDSLKPVVEQFKLEPQKSEWITREGSDVPLLNNDKFLRALFTDDVLKDRRNTEAVEIAPNMIASARVIEHEPAKQRPLAEVQPQIVRTLMQEKEAKLARQEGEAKLAQLKQDGQAAVSWSAPQMVTRERRAGLHPEAAQAVFGADASKLPAYVGVAVPDGRYVVYRISKVVETDSIDQQSRKSLARQMEQATGVELASASLASLKKKAEVKINRKAIEKSG